MKEKHNISKFEGNSLKDFRGKCIELNAYMGNEERSQISNLNTYSTKLDTE